MRLRMAGVTGPTVAWNRSSRGGGSRSLVARRRTRSCLGVGSTCPNPSGRSGSGPRAHAPGAELRSGATGAAGTRRRCLVAGRRRDRSSAARCRGRARGLRGPLVRGARREAAEREQQDERAPQSSRRSEAQRVSSWREDSCSLRSTLDTCVSTVLTEMNSSEATSL